MSSTIRSIQVWIGNTQSQEFTINLGGINYRLSNFSLDQRILHPNTLIFSLHKTSAETIGDARFLVCEQLIGKNVAVRVYTTTHENVLVNLAQNNQKPDLQFDGIIVSANATRDYYTNEYSIQVQAAAYETLLDGNPDCFSYIDKNLEEIVNDILGYLPNDVQPYLSPIVKPRFKSPINYCVMYNETPLQFLQRLARRYGEWLYNDGFKLVFGELPKKKREVSLKYPSNDIPYYRVELGIKPLDFENVTLSYHDNCVHKDGLDQSELIPQSGVKSSLLSQSIAASRYHYPLRNRKRDLISGGFANDDDGSMEYKNNIPKEAFAVLETASHSQGMGAKAGLITYSGMSYCAQLQIGSVLSINDNYLPQSASSSQTSQVAQDPILIVGISHTFSSDQSYSNRFRGIPAECTCPPYADPDIYPVCPSGRAQVVDNQDPLQLGRVKVQFPWQLLRDPKLKTPWIRVVQPYAGGGKGISFIPENGEEVLVDFEGGNADRPYVRGTLYNGKQLPDKNWLPNGNQGNQVKAIRTRNGHTIEIHDEGNGGFIQIYDNGRKYYNILLSTDRKLIRLEAVGNIELSAGNDIILEAKNNVSITSHQDTILYAEHNHTRAAKCDLTDDIGGNRSVKVAGNDTEVVEGAQRVQVKDSKDEEVQNNLQVTANNIRMEARNQLMEYSKIHQQKADNAMAMQGGTMIEIKAGNVKIN